MAHLLSYLPLLACPIGMGLMMWMMMRGGNHDQPADANQTPQTSMTPQQQAEFDQLRAEITQLRAAEADRTTGR